MYSKYLCILKCDTVFMHNMVSTGLLVTMGLYWSLLFANNLHWSALSTTLQAIYMTFDPQRLVIGLSTVMSPHSYAFSDIPKSLDFLIF